MTGGSREGGVACARGAAGSSESSESDESNEGGKSGKSGKGRKSRKSRKGRKSGRRKVQSSEKSSGTDSGWKSAGRARWPCDQPESCW